MTQFVDWLHSDAARQLHPVVYAVESHYRFVSIHPFRDGNGRTGRLLMNLLLLQRRYPIGVITHQTRQEYLEALVTAQQFGGSLDRLVNLAIAALQSSLLEVLSTVALLI